MITYILATDQPGTFAEYVITQQIFNQTYSMGYHITWYDPWDKRINQSLSSVLNTMKYERRFYDVFIIVISSMYTGFTPRDEVCSRVLCWYLGVHTIFPIIMK